jgi:hypothetical protein
VVVESLALCFVVSCDESWIGEAGEGEAGDVSVGGVSVMGENDR